MFKFFKKKRNMAISLVVLGLMVVGLGSVDYYLSHNMTSADALDDFFNKICVDQSTKVKQIDETVIPTRIQNLYGKTLTQATTGYILDFDTFSASWAGAPGGEATRLKYKALSNQVITEIKNLVGDPFQPIKVTVVYDPYFEDFGDYRSLNEYEAINASSEYRFDLNLLIYAIDEVDVQRFTHEIVHSFNDGAVGIEAYEEGMAESVANLVTKKLWPAEQAETAVNNKRPILANPAGLFRTINNNDLINNRYSAAADFFTKNYEKDPNFYKNFRKLVKENRYFAEISKNSTAFLRKMVIEGACSDLTSKNKNTMDNYLADMKQIIVQSIYPMSKYDPAGWAKYQDYLTGGRSASGTSPRRLSQATDLMNAYVKLKYPLIVGQYPIAEIFPANKAYTDLSLTNGSIAVYSTYKRNDFADLIMLLYKQRKGTVPNKIGLIDLGNFLKSNTKAESLTDLAQLFEEQSTTVNLKLVLPGTNPVTIMDINKASYAAPLKGFFGTISADQISQALTAAGKDTYTGPINLTATSRLHTIAAKTHYYCAGVLFQVCYPDGVETKWVDPTSSTSATITFSNGQISDLGNLVYK